MQLELGPAWSVPGRAIQVIRQGDAVSETIQYANESKSDLIVIATHGRTGLSRLLLGSVAEKIVRLSTCPVLTVHPEGHQFVLDKAAGGAATSTPSQTLSGHSRPDAPSHKKEHESMGDPHDIVCVYNTTNAMQAEMVRNLLEQNGLRATVGDTHNPFPGLTIMPAEVFVERADEKRALEIISRAEHIHHDENK
jgi:Universal stress protein family/Putative prokaryotic signal transducing protein